MAPQPITLNKDHLRDSIVLLHKGQISERNVTSKYVLSSPLVCKEIVTLKEHQQDLLNKSKPTLQEYYNYHQFFQ